jgi:hypothetical protein
MARGIAVAGAVASRLFFSLSHGPRESRRAQERRRLVQDDLHRNLRDRKFLFHLSWPGGRIAPSGRLPLGRNVISRPTRETRAGSTDISGETCSRIFSPSGVATDAREASLGKSAAQKSLDGFRDDSAQRAESSFEATLILRLEPVEELVENGVERRAFRPAGPVEFRGTGDTGQRIHAWRRSRCAPEYAPGQHYRLARVRVPVIV